MNIFNARTQFNIGGNRALFTDGGGNTFVGQRSGRINDTGGINVFVGDSAGFSNTSGSSGTFVGSEAGRSNSSGNLNSFFGRNAGRNNSSGGDNSFFGTESGLNNSTGGGNSFFGLGARRANTTGTNNSAFGTLANFSANNLNFATAVGSFASVSTNDTIVLGKVAGTYNGTAHPADTVQIPGELSANTVNSQTQFNIGGNRVLSVAGSFNLFAGVSAGSVNSTGSSNSFFGSLAGFTNTTGSNNTFIGQNADVSSNNLSYATAIGAGAVATSSNTITLGRTADRVLTPGGIALLDNSIRLRAADDNNHRIAFNSSINGIQFTAFDSFLWFNVANNRANMQLDTGGTLAIRGSYNQISDARYKTNVQTFGSALDTVRRLRGVTFNWKPELNKSSDRQIGFIAQEVEAVLPELVKTDEEGFKSVAYSNAVPVLVEAVKEQQTQIEAKQEQLDALREQIKQQQTTIDALKKLVCADKPNADVCKQP